MSALLAVDGGQSGLRMALVEDGRAVLTAGAAGFSHGSGDDALAIATAVSEARAALALDAPVARVCLGLSGAPADAERRARLAAMLSSRLDGAAVALGPDMVTAHAGALAGEPGVVVAAGTGAVVLGLGADGRAARADGLGYLLGDDGSGFAIGRDGVRAALRAREGRGAPTALVDAAEAFFGGLAGVTQRIYTSPAPVATWPRSRPRWRGSHAAATRSRAASGMTRHARSSRPPRPCSSAPAPPSCRTPAGCSASASCCSSRSWRASPSAVRAPSTGRRWATRSPVPRAWSIKGSARMPR